MNILVIGSGASLAECIEINAPKESYLPLIKNFASKTWDNFSPFPYLYKFLHVLGYNPEINDDKKLFFDLESKGITNIEHFFEFVWTNRYSDWVYELLEKFNLNNQKIDPWKNFLYNGIGCPISLLQIQCFFENGLGYKRIKLAGEICQYLQPGDTVLSINYDTIFEIALNQNSVPFVYAPNTPTDKDIIVCKPHGSLNLVISEERKEFTFGQPEWHGLPQPSNYKSYLGLIPPRLNKDFSQNPISKIILDSAFINQEPTKVSFWGIGLTESDIDLNNLYKKWSPTVSQVEIINPDKSIMEKFKDIFNCNIVQYTSFNDWIKSFS